MTPTNRPAGADADPMDYYDEFNSWITKNRSCANGEDLVGWFEDEDTFLEFLESRQ